jgi:hypothetical protein
MNPPSRLVPVFTVKSLDHSWHNWERIDRPRAVHRFAAQRGYKRSLNKLYRSSFSQ